MINTDADSKFEGLVRNLKSLAYDIDTAHSNDSIRLSAVKGSKNLKIEYTEEGERSGYSLYDLDLKIQLAGDRYIFILSERQSDNLKEDFRDIEVIIDAIEKDSYKFIEERVFVFWKKQYMTIKKSRQDLHLLKVNRA